MVHRARSETEQVAQPDPRHETSSKAAAAGSDRRARVARAVLRSARAALPRRRVRLIDVLRFLGSVLRSARAALPRRRVRLIDVLRFLGLARRAAPRPVVGPKAYPQWWQRILALLVLAATVVVIGLALAALVGLLVVVAGFLLEQAIA